MNKLQQAARLVLSRCLDAKNTESVLVVTDARMMELARLLYSAATRVSRDAVLVEVREGARDGAEPPAIVSRMMAAADVVLVVTSVQWHHSEARRMACRRGARVLSLSGITADALRRAVDVDYEELARRTRKLADVLTIGRRAHLTTPAGTDAWFCLEGKKGIAHTGLVHQRGGFSTFPAGMACIGPSPENTHGRIVIEHGLAGYARPDAPVVVDVKEGHATAVHLPRARAGLRHELRALGPEARTLAELGIGTNANARISGCMAEDCKVLGTVHVGLGNNRSFGGTVNVPFHADGILFAPSLEIDGRVIVRDGQVVL
ncbi:MAG: aminopeptidase [candidate division KSB1 bacterium]|nr:aminopeptidase [candidate division KSB1 bacterium]